MLYQSSIQGSSDILVHLNQMDSLTQSWIIPDLRTKKSIQAHFLQKQGFYPEDSILRISDLWKKILFRAQPQMKILSQSTLQTHVRAFLKKHAMDLQMPEGSDPSLIRWMQDLAPLYFHPESEEKVNDLWQAHPDQAERWKDWWLRAKVAFAYFESQSLLALPWVSAYLQRLDSLEHFWKRNLIIDLGGQLSSLEAGLLQNLSHSCDVLILEPHMQNQKNFQYWLRPYEELAGFAKKLSPQRAPEKTLEKQVKAEKLSSTLGSLRSVVAQARKWCEAGVPAQDIAIVAPDVERLWPSLRFHLEAEGLPFNRDTKVSLHSLSESQIFFSRLRALSKNLSSRDFELNLFSGSGSVDLNVEKFRALFKNIYDENDYQRHTRAFATLQLKSDLQAPMNCDEFLVLLVSLWTGSEVPSWLETLLRQVLADFTNDLKLNWSEWVLFAENSLSATELTQDTGHPDGLVIASLGSAHFLQVNYLILIELSEENLRHKAHRGLSSDSVKAISKNLGFWLEDREQSPLEFELAWLLQNEVRSLVLHFSEVNLLGELQTPSSYWLGFPATVVEQPPMNVMDSRMLKSFEVLSPRLKMDLNQLPIPDVKPSKKLTLSPSSFESFVNCPFVFFARHWMGLQNFPEVDLDQDPRDKGQFVHKLFESLLRLDKSSWAGLDLETLVQKVAEELGWILDPMIWKAQKLKYIKLAQRFIDTETHWQTQFPRLKKSYLEIKWQGELEGVAVKGQIDRVDASDQNELIIFDYKSSKARLAPVHQWLEKQQYQMLFYILALENKWTPEIEGEILAALYYVTKDFERKVGWVLPDPREGFFEPVGTKKQRLTKAELDKIISEFLDSFRSTSQRVKQGEIGPKPLELESCEKCDWRRTCRAPHLH